MKEPTNVRAEGGAAVRCSAWLDLVKTGVQIRNEVKAIINSRPANLADNLADYIVRGRNELLRACNNRLHSDGNDSNVHRRVATRSNNKISHTAGRKENDHE